MLLNRLILACFTILSISNPAQAADSVILNIPMETTIPVSGSLAVITELRAVSHSLEEQLSIAEKQAKLNELQMKAVTLTPANLMVPVPSPSQKANIATPPKRPREVRVVSVQGINGKLSATIRTAEDTLVTVLQNGRFAGGTAEISRSGVNIRSGRSTKTLTFE